MALFCIILFSLGTVVVIMQHCHLLSLFMGLEFMSLSALMLLATMNFSGSWICLLFLCMMVCEASIALTLIVVAVRICSDDRISSLCVDKS
nr:NADH dehydrogenase subunit 4L [Semimytilus algosus]